MLYEECSRRGISGWGNSVHTIVAHYFLNHGTDEQKRHYLPRLARGEIVICDEIDLCDTDFYVRALQKLQGEGYDFVVGSKALASSHDRRPAFRRLATFVLNFLFRVFLGFKGTDTHGLKAFRRTRLLEVVDRCKVDRDLFTSEFVIRAERMKFRIVEIPIDIQSALISMPADLSPLASDLGRAYLDQIFVHGLIHADPHPGNVVLTADQDLVLLDLGMVGHVPPRMRDQLLKLILATTEGRGEQVAETLMHMGTRLEDFDEPRFTRETGRMVARFSNSSVRTDSEGGFLLQLVRVGGECGLRPPAELTLLGKTLLNLEDVMLALDAKMSMRDVLQGHLAELFRARTRASLDVGRLATDALEMQELIRESPQRLSVLLRTLADNRFKVNIAGLEESHLIESMQKIANRITVGIIAAAMIVGAALIMDVQTSQTLFGYPALALVMFLIAAGLGAALVVSILVGDRKARPKAEKDPL